jgi:hypothetical protein
MGAFRGMRWLKAPLAGAAWAALGLGVAPGALAQAPIRGVEVWYGLERVRGGREAPARPSEPPPPTKAAPAGATLAPGVYVLPAASYPFTPNAPPPGVLPGGPAFLPDAGHSAGAPLPLQRPEGAGPRHGEVVPTAHWREDRPGGGLDSAVPAEPVKTQAEAPRRPAPRPEAKAEKPAAAPSPPAPAPVPAAVGAAEKPRRPNGKRKARASSSITSRWCRC